MYPSFASADLSEGLNCQNKDTYPMCAEFKVIFINPVGIVSWRMKRLFRFRFPSFAKSVIFKTKEELNEYHLLDSVFNIIII